MSGTNFNHSTTTQTDLQTAWLTSTTQNKTENYGRILITASTQDETRQHKRPPPLTKEHGRHHGVARTCMRYSGRASRAVPSRCPSRYSERYPEQYEERYPERSPGAYPERNQERYPKRYSKRYPERCPEWCPGWRMPRSHDMIRTTSSVETRGPREGSGNSTSKTQQVLLQVLQYPLKLSSSPRKQRKVTCNTLARSRAVPPPVSYTHLTLPTKA